MAGLLSGNSAILKSMIGEITDETNQARAYPLESVTWAAGCVLGPLIGGHLSHPVERYPSLFGNVEFLKNYPYFLPCAVSSCITFGSTLIAILFLEETIPKKVSPLECKFSEQDDLVKQYMAIPKTVTDEEPAYPAKQLLADPQIRGLMVVGFLLSFLHVSWDTVFVLFAYTRAQLGGLERTVSHYRLNAMVTIATDRNAIYDP
ncbi:hypothetical protein FRB98_008480 [Tulasnella sp. 332]|nr:hypothetical protein FRB98_008480 [Tulasnella sp. 332]